MKEKIFICPAPAKWEGIYYRLSTFHRSMPDRTQIPDVPRALIGPLWAHSSDEQKQARWQETVKWANDHGFTELIPELQTDEQYFGEGYGTWVCI